MKKYSLTSNKYSGAITFWYNDEGVLVYYHNDTEMELSGHVWMLKNLPRDLSELEYFQKSTKGTLVEVPEEVSFDIFWDSYAKKVNRKRAEQLWNKMPEAKQLLAVLSIKPYDKYLARVKWRSKADPDTYLRNQNYETDWNKIIE